MLLPVNVVYTSEEKEIVKNTEGKSKEIGKKTSSRSAEEEKLERYCKQNGGKVGNVIEYAEAKGYRKNEIAL